MKPYRFSARIDQCSAEIDVELTCEHHLHDVERGRVCHSTASNLDWSLAQCFLQLRRLRASTMNQDETCACTQTREVCGKLT
jgi:hypothetical protein